MTALVDLQAVVWYVQDDRRLGRSARTMLASGEHALLISAASLWELAIKVSLRKFKIDAPLEEYVEKFITGLRMRVLDVTQAHALGVAVLPHLHNDPFDRLLIAQAQHERVPIVTGDETMSRYDVQTIW